MITRHRSCGDAIRAEVHIAAPPEEVWDEVGDISNHVTWMDDAVAIRFTGPATGGVGTSFDCDTRIGPFRLTDRMTVTEWRPPERMGIRHTGLVIGNGRFRIEPLPGARSRFVWQERLVFPWWMGGRAGARAAAPILARIWHRNLHNLKRRIEQHGPPAL